MRVFRALRVIAIPAALLLLSLALGLPATAAARTRGLATDVIAAPSGSVLLFSYEARGVQIYECLDGGWALHAPRALLFEPESHRPTGDHYGGIDRGLTPGPWWESAADGSRIRGSRVDSAPSPNANSIPLLLLEVQEREGDGVFSAVSHILRLNTQGGISPTGTCAPGARRHVPYTADYAFYAAP